MEYDLSADILPTLPWEEENPIEENSHRVSIFYFSLTTCVYCKKGLQLLKDEHFSFHLLYLDNLELAQKQAIKKWIQQKYQLKTRIASPFVIFRLDGVDYISNGYDPDYWKSKMR